MLVAVLIVVAAIFAALGVLRFVGARRRSAMRHAPTIIAGAAAILFALRGRLVPAAIIGLGAFALWLWSQRDRIDPEAAPRPPRAPGGEGMSEAQARAILGVRPGASETEIRSAFRQRIARAHPDLGGSTEEAARLSAARDALLRR